MSTIYSKIKAGEIEATNSTGVYEIISPHYYINKLHGRHDVLGGCEHDAKCRDCNLEELKEEVEFDFSELVSDQLSEGETLKKLFISEEVVREAIRLELNKNNGVVDQLRDDIDCVLSRISHDMKILRVVWGLCLLVTFVTCIFTLYAILF